MIPGEITSSGISFRLRNLAAVLDLEPEIAVSFEVGIATFVGLVLVESPT